MYLDYLFTFGQNMCLNFKSLANHDITNLQKLCQYYLIDQTIAVRYCVICTMQVYREYTLSIAYDLASSRHTTVRFLLFVVGRLGL